MLCCHCSGRPGGGPSRNCVHLNRLHREILRSGLPGRPQSASAPSAGCHKARPGAAGESRRSRRITAQPATTDPSGRAMRPALGRARTPAEPWPTRRGLLRRVLVRRRLLLRGTDGCARNRTAPLMAPNAMPGRQARRLLRPCRAGAGLQRPHALGRGSFRPRLDGELNRLPFAERTKALHLDFGLVTEQILAAIVGRNEAVALGIVEPLHFSVHCWPSLSGTFPVPDQLQALLCTGSVRDCRGLGMRFD